MIALNKHHRNAHTLTPGAVISHSPNQHSDGGNICKSWGPGLIPKGFW